MKANALHCAPAPFATRERDIALARAAHPIHGILLLTALLTWSSQASTADVVVHGFGTIAATYLDKPSDWAYSRSLNKFITSDSFRTDLDSVLGIQVNYRPTATLELVGQIAASRLARQSRAADYLEMAYAAWRPASWTIRLGRVNHDAFMISDHRDVGFTYPFVRPPVEFYSRLPTSLDGGDVSRTWTNGGTQWQAKLFGGRTTAGVGDARLKISPLVGVLASRESAGLQLRISAIRGRSLNDLAGLQPLVDGLQQIQQVPVPQVASDAAALEATLSTRGMRTTYLAAAAAYELHDWLLSTEVNRNKVAGKPAVSFRSGYVSIGRRFGPWTAFVTESIIDRDSHVFHAPDWATPLAGLGPQMAQQAQQLADGAAIAVNNLAPTQYTTSLGLRWDVASQLDVKLQWDHIRNPANATSLWGRADGRAATSNLLTMAMDFVF